MQRQPLKITYLYEFQKDGSGDEQHDIETEVKEQIKQKEVFVGGLDKDADEDDLKKVLRSDYQRILCLRRIGSLGLFGSLL